MREKEELKKLIADEDRHNPLTDKQLANKLNISREKVTCLRNELEILTSKERLKVILIEDIKRLLKDEMDVSTRELTRKLKGMGYNVSRYLVSKELDKVKEEIETTDKEVESEKDLEDNSSHKIAGEKEEVKESPFKKLIGYDGSLKSQVQQAKAAVLYPPYGLHTLLIGESGVGKSFLAKLMYEFAISEEKIESEKFITFNCADYAENPQLLYSQLFGHVKGAFTGANKEKNGLIKKANGGIIFLDEVHRLPAEGQEMLFNVIDNGRYRRLGETEREEEVNVMIIAATTEEIESYLLATFRRRIPMIIELSPLQERSLKERLEFLKSIISRESKQIDKTIIVTYEAGRVLLNYTPDNNIGQLESDLKVLCARAYLQFVTGEKDKVEISLDILSPNIKRGFLKEPVRRKEISKLISADLIINPEDEELIFLDSANLKEDRLVQDIYKYIEDKNEELKDIGVSQEDINQELTTHIEEKLNLLFKKADFENNNYLLEIVGEDLIKLVNEILVIAQQELPQLVLKTQLKYALAIHLNAALQRIRNGNTVVYPELQKVKIEYAEIFEVAQKIVNLVEQRCNLDMPEDEVAYLTMYLNTVINQEEKEDNQAGIGVIVVSHGKVASNMLKVANWLLGDSNARAIDMDLDESPVKLLDMLISIAKELDQGKGVLLLVDMGSLITLGEIIEERAGIKVRVVPRVDTVMLMEAIRWSMLKDMKLDMLVDRIEKNNYLQLQKRNEKRSILIFCITGEGTANRIKDYLLHRLPQLETNFEIITAGFINEDLDLMISELKAKGELASIIGNLPPKNINRDKFFTIEEIFMNKGLNRFKEVLGITGLENKVINLNKLIDKELIFSKLKVSSKEEVIDKLSHQLVKEGVVKESFFKGVMKREEWASTYIGSGIAIPHASSEYVNYSQIALAILDKPIEWSGNEVDIVCVFAIKDFGVEYFKEVYKNLQENLSLIRTTVDVAEIKEVVVNGRDSH